MTPHHYTEFFNQKFPNRRELMEFKMEILMVFKDLVQEPVYSSECLEMILHQNHVILTSLKHFSKSIRERYSGMNFELQLWNNYFHCAISFMTQSSLQLENFLIEKRMKIFQKYKDMRREMAIDVRAMWFSLGDHKILFVPGIIGPFVEMTLIPDKELRKATIPIFYDMMISEFISPPPVKTTCSKKENFHGFERELITQLDKLVEGGKGDEEYKELLHQILGNLSDNDHRELFRGQVLQFIQIIRRLMKASSGIQTSCS